MNVIREFQTIFKRKTAINTKVIKVNKINKHSLERLNALGFIVIITNTKG